MVFYWDLALLSLTGGLILLLFAYVSICYERTLFAPATAMSFTWAIALVSLSFLPLIGFYHISASTTLLYVLGAVWFSTISLLISWVLGKVTKNYQYPPLDAVDCFSFNRIITFWIILALIVYPISSFQLLNYGSNIVEISYTIRRLSVSGEQILSPWISNFFVVIGIFSNLVLFGVVRKRVNLTLFIILILPFLFLSLVISGRSGLVSLIIGWLVIISVYSPKLNIAYIILSLLFLLAVMFLGGVWVKKFDIEDASLSDSIGVLISHVLGYLYQGPVLFSRYFNGELDISTNWDFFNSACHVFSKVGWCSPRELHADFSEYGPGSLGNVYSIYFSIIPHYGLLGLTVVFFLYAILLTVLFNRFRSVGFYAICTYPLIISEIFLSVFKDGIGYSFYFLLKVAIICFILKFLIFKKKQSGLII